VNKTHSRPSGRHARLVNREVSVAKRCGDRLMATLRRPPTVIPTVRPPSLCRASCHHGDDDVGKRPTISPVTPIAAHVVLQRGRSVGSRIGAITSDPAWVRQLELDPRP
jgi:hypothetical protein